MMHQQILKYLVVHYYNTAFLIMCGPFGVATMPKEWVCMQSVVLLTLRAQHEDLFWMSILFAYWRCIVVPIPL